MTGLTAFTVATKRYEPFVLPWLASVLIHNPEAIAEVAVENPDDFAVRNQRALAMLDDRWRLSRADFQVNANTTRFQMEPQVRSDFVYIGDIDILVLEPICAPHIAHMQRTGLPYSNIIRQGQKRLTGLHFARWDAFYPVTPLRADFDGKDESALYNMMLDRGLPLPDEADDFRPLHGYHMSLNCAANGWGGIRSKEYVQAYSRLRSNATWRQLPPVLDKRYQGLLMALEAYLHGVFPETRHLPPTCLPKDWW